MIPGLVERFPERRIIVRPHPSESPEAWRRATAGLPRVEVRYDDALLPWLLACEALIHNGCTTGVEAALLGRRPIAYRPHADPSMESPQPRRASLEVADEQELHAALADGARENNAALDDMVASRQGPLAAERIADFLVASLQTDIRLPTALRRGQARLAAGTRALQKRVQAQRRGSPAQESYIARKFPPTPFSEIEARLRRLAEALQRPLPGLREVEDRIYEINPL